VPIEGELTVCLDWDGDRVTGVDVRSTRPFAATRILAGKTPAAAVATVPKLFAICGGAQGAAAAGALVAAGATGVEANGVRNEHGVALEAIQEHFWRLLIDWPQVMGDEARPTPVANVRHRVAATVRTTDGRSTLGDPAAMHALGAELSRLAARSIYGMPPADWLELGGRPALESWIARAATSCAKLLGRMFADLPTLGRTDVRLMPAPRIDALMSVVVPALDRDPHYARAPTWDGLPAETGALARVRAHPLVAALAESAGHTAATRFVARLVDLALLLGELGGASRPPGALPWVQAFAVGDADGLAAVQTARGLLLHRVRIAEGRVADYRIVAPTEWNFHPEGALARGLAGMVAENEMALKRQARVAVQALDPCVACRVEIVNA
jgi:Ni,Fe-hydrogenase I large subunit